MSDAIEKAEALSDRLVDDVCKTVSGSAIPINSGRGFPLNWIRTSATPLRGKITAADDLGRCFSGPPLYYHAHFAARRYQHSISLVAELTV